MTEMDVMLTDYGLMVLCSVLASLLRRRADEGFFRTQFELFFGAVAVASLFGGTVHGFFLNENTPAHQILAALTFISIGVAGFSVWTISARMLFDQERAKLISKMMLGVLVMYIIVVLKFALSFTLSLMKDYIVAIVYYLPAAVAFLGVLLRKYLKGHEKQILFGILGLFLTFVAAGIQQAKIGLSPVYFNHDALYHLVQAAGLYLIFLCALYLTKTGKN